MISSPVEEIKNRLNIVDVIGNYIKLHKAGANFRAICPFHSEKKPSFFVSPARQIWHCFGCSKGGNIFQFIMDIENVEFGDALRILAQKAGVELKPLTKESANLRTERNRLYEICELATKFFGKQLEASKVGLEAKKYLLGRGITEESIKKWRLGYAPDTWQGLSDFLAKQGYKEEEAGRAGLSIKNEEGSFYDRFRGRIIFPIFDLNSQVVGFGARIFGDKKRPDGTPEAKYINTPSTLLYDKSRILYGLDVSKIEIRKENSCTMVEGYTDVILSSQAGFKNVVAASGTALSSYQLKVLKRYSENLVLAFDMDIAGDTAAKRGIDLAQIQGFNIKVVRLAQDQDPADIISKNPKDWEAALKNAKSIYEFYFENAFSKADKKIPEGKKEISKILLPTIKRIPNKIEQSFWVQKLARELEVKEESIVEELKKVKLEEEVYGLEPEEIINLPQKSRKELLEERLLTMLLKSPQKLDLIEEGKISLFSQKIQEIFAGLKKDKNFSPSPKTDLGILDYFNYVSLKAEVEEIDEKEILPEIQFCLREIRSLEIKNKLDSLAKEIKSAEDEKDYKKIEKLSKDFNILIKEIL